MLFQEYDFLDRFEHAAKAGFSGIEYLSPYDYSKTELRHRLDQFALTQVLFNMPAGDWAAGDRGLGCIKSRQDEFKRGVEAALEYASVLGSTQINCLAGLKPEDESVEQAADTFIENLNYAAPLLKAQGIRLLVEPINSKDMPGYLVNTTDEGMAIINQVDADNVYLQADIYHMQRMEGDLIKRLQTLLPQICHMQFADNPGRHEPGTGEINFEVLFNAIDQMGYDGWLSAEYLPAENTGHGLVWLDHYSGISFA